MCMMVVAFHYVNSGSKTNKLLICFFFNWIFLPHMVGIFSGAWSLEEGAMITFKKSLFLPL